ncbi:MAG: SIR2 family protein [Planctomycetia bacterium]|nr:SIR2 family protein [Planctomycetia bacterium]
MAKPLVVYVLGAGFSRPLGLPLVHDFIRTARDLYRENPAVLPHFSTVFDRLDSLAPIQNHLHANHLNIEEVLSTMEMEDALRETEVSQDVRRFIADVVQLRTPPLPQRRSDPDQPITQMYADSGWARYVGFLEGIFGARSSMSANEVVEYDAFGLAQTSYGIVTLNYDCVLETATEILRRHANNVVPSFARSLGRQGIDPNRPSLAKLHGCASEPWSIVPMTWNKTIKTEIQSEWRLAFQLLLNASEVRFIGYSLPAGDAYVRYLLKAALRSNRSLRQIDVITLDSDGETLDRYAKLISLPFSRRVVGTAQSYLDSMEHATRSPNNGAGQHPRRVRLADNLEGAHAFALDQLEAVLRRGTRDLSR